MSRCTAPVRGHRSAAAAADCPVCGSRYGGYRSTYSSYSPSYSSYEPPRSSSPSYSWSASGSGGGGRSSGSVRARWSPVGSAVLYTPQEVQALTPIREAVEKIVALPDRRDFFLCHAWDDRTGAAKELHTLLESRGVSVWFSERDITLGAVAS